MTRQELFQVEEIEATSFDEHGIEEDIWRGYAVTKVDDPANYCFDMRDKNNADNLCEFLNNDIIVDVDNSIDAFVLDNCIEWNNLISELSKQETELMKSKETYTKKEFGIVYQSNIDFKKLYNSTSEKVRKQHAQNELKELDDKIKYLELSIDYLKRRISFIRQLVPVKTALLEQKNE